MNEIDINVSTVLTCWLWDSFGAMRDMLTCLGIWQQLYLNSLNILNAQIITSRYINCSKLCTKLSVCIVDCWVDLILIFSFLSWCFAFKHILPFLVSSPAIYRQSVETVQSVQPDLSTSWWCLARRGSSGSLIASQGSVPRWAPDSVCAPSPG